MTRASYTELARKLAQARRLASEPNDPLTRLRLIGLIKGLEADFRRCFSLLEGDAPRISQPINVPSMAYVSDYEVFLRRRDIDRNDSDRDLPPTASS
jgi:hypothetical protein